MLCVQAFQYIVCGIYDGFLLSMRRVLTIDPVGNRSFRFCIWTTILFYLSSMFLPYHLLTLDQLLTVGENNRTIRLKPNHVNSFLTCLKNRTLS